VKLTVWIMEPEQFLGIGVSFDRLIDGQNTLLLGGDYIEGIKQPFPTARQLDFSHRFSLLRAHNRGGCSFSCRFPWGWLRVIGVFSKDIYQFWVSRARIYQMGTANTRDVRRFTQITAEQANSRLIQKRGYVIMKF
jgi:hypothetical protein